MVGKGQFLERSTLIPSGKGVLEALSHRGDKRPPLLIIPPVPEEGGSMDHVIAAEVAWAAASAGFPTLRFNFKGVGGSQGERGDDVLEDLEGALRLIQENTDTTSVVCLAISQSAKPALELARRHPALAGLVFVSPVGIGGSDLAPVSLPLLVVMGARDIRQPRVAFASAVTEAGGRFEMVEDADHVFQRNLPEVGRHVRDFLRHLSVEDPAGPNRFTHRS
ncbi:MAG: alpha/beta hydrolase [Myxococcaceae bacterium]